MEERTIKKKYIIYLIVIIIAILFSYKPIEREVLQKVYPCEYSEYVEKYAKEYGVDHLLIYAIIKTESNFKPNSTSSSGAKGVMQLMENTAEEMAVDMQMPYNSNQTIYEVESNIRMGTKYFSDLMKNYNGNIYLSLTAYNAGMGNVAKWIEAGTIQKDRK